MAKILKTSLEEFNAHSKVDVCLCLNPQSNNVSAADTLTILSDNTVSCTNENLCNIEYTFSKVFGPDIDQLQFFNIWVYDKVLRFVNGNDELIFTCGTINNENNPGMIPRTLSLVFNVLSNKLMPQCRYKPYKVILTTVLDETLMQYEENIRNNILNNWFSKKSVQDNLKFQQVYDGQNIHNIDQLNHNKVIKIFDFLKYDKQPTLDHGDVSYIVWVTCFEVYKECIYDLLISCSADQKPLKLLREKNKNIYVKDLTHVFVQSAEEAYKIMYYGRSHSKFMNNNLNKSMNYSHCIFTLKLIRIENIENPESTIISSISFCELGCPEYFEKTMTYCSSPVTEVTNLTTLSVLIECFSVLRKNQKYGENNLVPCSKSKLTKMFSTALIGNTKTGISMIVTVDMSPNLLNETTRLLLMFAITKRVSKSTPSFDISKNITQNNSKEGIMNEYEKTITDEGSDVELNGKQFKNNNIFNTFYKKSNNFETMIENNATFLKSLNLNPNRANRYKVEELFSQINICKAIIDEAKTEYNYMKSKLIEMHNVVNTSLLIQKIEEKDLEIEKLNGLLNKKDNIIKEMTTIQEELMTGEAEQYKAIGIKNTIVDIKTKIIYHMNKKSSLKKKYETAQHNLNWIQTENQFHTNSSLLSSNVSNLKVAEFQEQINEIRSKYKKESKQLKKLNSLMHDIRSQVKPDMISVAVSTNIQKCTCIGCDHKPKQQCIVKLKKREAKTLTKSLNTRMLNDLDDMDIPEMCDKLFDETINKIPTSTRKRKLFIKHLPLTAPSDLSNSVPSTIRVLQQTSKQVKK